MTAAANTAQPTNGIAARVIDVAAAAAAIPADMANPIETAIPAAPAPIIL